MADINQALTFALAGVPASAVQGGVAQGASGFSVLASATWTANREEEPVSEVNSKVGIRHGLASGVWRGRLQKGPGASAAIALKVTGVILGEEIQNFVPLLFRRLFGEQALHFLDSVFHGGESVDRSSVAGSSLNSHGTGLLELGGDRRAFGGEGGPGLDAESGGDFLEAKEPTADQSKGAGVLDPAESKTAVLGTQAGNVGLPGPNGDRGGPRNSQDRTQRGVEYSLELIKPRPGFKVSSEEVVHA